MPATPNKMNQLQQPLQLLLPPHDSASNSGASDSEFPADRFWACSGPETVAVAAARVAADIGDVAERGSHLQ